jgi:uridine kinase
MLTPMSELDKTIEAIISKRKRLSQNRSLLVGVSGIDGSGKGSLAKQLLARLWQRSIHAVTLNADAWLNLPGRRFSPHNPAQHFYDFAIRFDEMFRDLVLPFRNSRSCKVDADLAEETATEYRRHTYKFDDIDVIVLEGIFLFKREYQRHFDLSIWIDCSFETALARALRRGQEKLSIAETIRAYETIYFPAQMIHLAHDNPRLVADLVINNDSAESITRLSTLTTTLNPRFPAMSKNKLDIDARRALMSARSPSRR